MYDFQNIQEILKRNIRGYVDSREVDSNIIVTIPKADSMFFREMEEFPLLQQLSILKREGIVVNTDYSIDEGDDVYDYLRFSFSVNEDIAMYDDWRTLLEISGEPHKFDATDNMDFIRSIFS